MTEIATVLAAASSAADATAQLTLAAYEGDLAKGQPIGDELLEKLLDAVKLVMELEDDFTDQRGQLYGAITNFLEG